MLIPLKLELRITPHPDRVMFDPDIILPVIFRKEVYLNNVVLKRAVYMCTIIFVP